MENNQNIQNKPMNPATSNASLLTFRASAQAEARAVMRPEPPEELSPLRSADYGEGLELSSGAFKGKGFLKRGKDLQRLLRFEGFQVESDSFKFKVVEISHERFPDNSEKKSRGRFGSQAPVKGSRRRLQIETNPITYRIDHFIQVHIQSLWWFVRTDILDHSWLEPS